MKIILGLLLFSPLLITLTTPEVFEFPKMMLIYLVALLLLGLELLQLARNLEIHWLRTPLNKTIGLILISTLISTLVAFNSQTALYGYYTRFTEGLIATLAFMTIFFALLACIRLKDVRFILRSVLLITVIISIYGILQRFGVDAGFWKQPSPERVFSTLGQPNWLAA